VDKCLPKGIRVSDPKEAVEKDRTQALPFIIFFITFVKINIPWLKGRGVSRDIEPCRFSPVGKPVNKTVGRNGDTLSDGFFFCIR